MKAKVKAFTPKRASLVQSFVSDAGQCDTNDLVRSLDEQSDGARTCHGGAILGDMAAAVHPAQKMSLSPLEGAE